MKPSPVCPRSSRAPLQLRDALEKSGLPGAAALPALPAKRLFGSQSDAVTRERLAAFNALLTAIGASEALAAADATCAFLSCAPARPPSAAAPQRRCAVV